MNNNNYIKLLFVLYLLINLVLSDCHSGEISFSKPTLGIHIENIKNAQTNDRIYARIHYGNKLSKNWTDWRRLYHSDCNNFEKGNIDYFNDFEDIKQKWYAVALYNCGNDGIGLSGITYWNGNKWQNNIIENFCGNVAGPVSNCYHGEININDEKCYFNEYNDKIYKYVWLSQSNSECHGVSISTSGKLTDNITPVGKIYY